jgi:hypothetical protein
MLQDFNPGSNAAPKQYWSFTIGASGTHCPRGWLNLMRDYMEHFDLKGAAALEKGGRNAIQHIQAVIEVACGTSADGKKSAENTHEALLWLGCYTTAGQNDHPSIG